MSSLSSLFTRPSTIGAIAVAGSGAFYVGLKYRTFTAPEGQGIRGPNRDGRGQNFEVKSGREGGGV